MTTQNVMQIQQTSSPTTNSEVEQDLDENNQTRINQIAEETRIAQENTPKTMTLPQTGDVLSGRYRLEEKLGQGGMGFVFKALDLTKQEVRANNPYVAIKLLLPELTTDNDLITGFHREAEKAQKLTHANIIKVFLSGRDGNFHYIVMEYLEGMPLNQVIRETGAMPLNKAWSIIRNMGLGLIHAHEKNIIHSDFKPANVFLLKESNEIKILDFGIAVELKKGNETDETVFNPRTQGAYSPIYASFETLNGVKADQRDDIFSFGLVVYELLTGNHPYNRKPASKVAFERKNGHDQSPVQPSGLNKKQWQLLSAAIAIEQKDRPANLQTWLKAFEPNTPKVVQKNKTTPMIIAGLLILTTGIGWIWFINKTDDINPPLTTVDLNKNKPRNLPKDVAVIETPSSADTNTPILPKKMIEQQTPIIDNPPLDVVSPKLNLKTSQNRYHIGDYLKVIFQPNQDGYVRIIDFRKGRIKKTQTTKENDISVVFPNQFVDETGKVEAGKTYQIPPETEQGLWQIGSIFNTQLFIAIFSKEPLPNEEKLLTYINDDSGLNRSDLPKDLIVETISYQVTK